LQALLYFQCAAHLGKFALRPTILHSALHPIVVGAQRDFLMFNAKPLCYERPLMVVWLLLAWLACSAAWAKPPAKAKSIKENPPVTSQSVHPFVDSNKVHQLYMDGEFDAAITMLEDNLKSARQLHHDDSVFIYKHLGVMYAAQYETREKGKYYMVRLLEVEPSAKIMDMYASDMIYMIFKNIQEEYVQKRRRISADNREESRRDSLANSDPGRGTPKAESQPKSGSTTRSGTKKWIWTGVAAAALVGGIGAFFLLNDTAPEKVVEF
jgi:hypothetical protein